MVITCYYGVTFLFQQFMESQVPGNLPVLVIGTSNIYRILHLLLDVSYGPIFLQKVKVNSMLIGDLRKTMSNNYWHSKFYSLPWETKIQIFNVMFVCWSFSRINIRMATYRDWVLHGLYLLNKGIDLTGKIRDHGLQVCMKNKTIIHSNQRSHSLSAKGKLNTCIFIQFFSNLFTPLKNLFCKRRKIWRMRILVQMQVQLHWHH